MKILSANIFKYYLWRFVFGFYFLYVLQAIYLLSKGFTPVQLGLFASVVTISTTVMEIPTGFIADKFSRKLSIALGFLISGLSYLGLIFITNITSLLVVAFFLGLAEALKSGATESLLYDDLKTSNQESDYLKVTTKGSTLGTISSAIGSFFGPILYTVHTSIPFVLSAIPHLFLSVYILTFDEKRSSHEVDKQIKLFDGIKDVISNRKLCLIAAMDTILLVFVIIYYQVLYSPKITHLGLDIRYLGALDVINLLLMSAMLLILPRITSKNGQLNLIVYTLLPVAAFVLFGAANQLVPALIAGVFFDLAWSARRHIIPAITNKFFESQNRALGLSSLSFINGLGAAVLVPVLLVFFTGNYLFALVPAFLIVVLLIAYTRIKSVPGSNDIIS